MSLARYAQTNLRSCTIGSRFPSKQLVNNQLEALQLSLSSKRLLSSSAVHFSNNNNNNNNEWRTEPREKTEEQQETAVKKRLTLKVEYDIPRQKKHLYVVPKDQYDASYRVSRMLKETSIEEAMSYTAALRIGLQSTAVWNLLMKACAEQGRANLADKCFVQMRKRGFRPNTFTFTHLLSALANSKSPEAVERAEEWLEKMQYNYNLTPTEKHYNTLLQVYERANYSTNAIFQRLRNLPFKPDSITFTILFKCAAREEDAKSVRFLWREMEKELDRSKVQDVNRPPTEQSKLAQKAAELLEKDTTFKEAVKEVQSSRLTLDDPLIVAMLRALAQTATTSDDLWFGIRIIESLYGLRPPVIEKRIKEQLNEKYEPFKSRPMEITNPTLDAILWLCGSLGQFKLGREYYKEAIRQFPAFKPDAAVVKKAGWLGIEESKTYQNAKSNRKNRKD